MDGTRSALVIPFELPEAIERIRQAEVDNAALGVPAHVTILVPFVSPSALDERVLGTVAEVAASVPAFRVHFREVRRFEPGPAAPEGVLWLAPEPAEPFLELIRAFAEAFPGMQPYEGLHEEVVPHLTIATADAGRMDAAESEARRWLPFQQPALRLVLLVEGDDAIWRREADFALG